MIDEGAEQTKTKVEHFLDSFGILLYWYAGPGLGGPCEVVPDYEGPMSNTLRRIGFIIGPANLARTLANFDAAYQEAFGRVPDYRERLAENLKFKR